MEPFRDMDDQEWGRRVKNMILDIPVEPESKEVFKI